MGKKVPAKHQCEQSDKSFPDPQHAGMTCLCVPACSVGDKRGELGVCVQL